MSELDRFNRHKSELSMLNSLLSDGSCDFIADFELMINNRLNWTESGHAKRLEALEAERQDRVDGLSRMKSWLL
jgi:hypothetical protein